MSVERRDDLLHLTSDATLEVTSEPSPSEVTGNDVISLSHVALCTFLFLVVLLTIFGNIVVLAAIATQKKLRNSNFMLYIANLAVTDLAVALTAMSFYTFDILLGYWPFGEILCGIWIFFDYGMTFASVFTLVAISLDRFWSVTWSLHYRNHNNKKKTLLVIASTWLLVLITWLGPCIDDRLKWSEPNVCIWEPSNNQNFVVFIAVFGHHTPCVIMVFCYIWVYIKMRSRKNLIKPSYGGRSGLNGDLSLVTLEGNTRTTLSVPDAQAPKITTGQPKEGTVTPGKQNGGRNKTNGGKKEKIMTSSERERRTFITLSYVILSYVICWVPFHVVFDISAVAPEMVPNTVYVCTFFLTYVNSTLNPLLYAFSSRDFRKAFSNVIRFRFEK